MQQQEQVVCTLVAGRCVGCAGRCCSFASRTCWLLLLLHPLDN
jgi:hypothetical protein